MTSAPLTRQRALRLAWPMIFANAAVPLAGVVDTAVIGATGTAADLGGVALGGLLFNIFYWSFYFLRMGSTGLAAQAAGAGDDAEIQRVLLRAGLLGAAAGLGILLLRGPIAAAGFAVLQGGPGVEDAGAAYFFARSWGAPGALATFALTGWLIGLGRSGAVLAVHVVLSAVNIVLDLVFVLKFGWGVAGVGAATAIAEWCAAGVGLVYVAVLILRGGGLTAGVWRIASIFDPVALRRMFGLSWDLMLRTWALILGFSWFTNAAAKQATDVLAGTHVLLQVITVWAFVLDAFAFTAEVEVGRAIGSKSVPRLRRAIRVTSELAVASGLVFMAATFLFGPRLLDVWIADDAARAAAKTFLPYCALVPFLGAAAWQLDGIFIGATRTVAMRNATFIAVALYFALDAVLTPRFGPHGMWAAFVGFYLTRAGTLAAAYPGLERALKSQTGMSTPTASATDA